MSCAIGEFLIWHCPKERVPVIWHCPKERVPVTVPVDRRLLTSCDRRLLTSEYTIEHPQCFVTAVRAVA